MPELQQHGLRDTLRELRADIEALRRRSTSGTFVRYDTILKASTSNPISTLGVEFPLTGYYARMGDVVILEGIYASMYPGISSVGVGTYSFDLPFQAPPAITAVLGQAYLIDSSAGTTMAVNVIIDTFGSRAVLMTPAGARVTHSSPIAWAVGDGIAFGTIVYRTTS